MTITEHNHEEEEEDPYDDMPCLLCGTCNGAVTRGGREWEKQHPHEPQCICGLTIPNYICTTQFLNDDGREEVPPQIQHRE